MILYQVTLIGIRCDPGHAHDPANRDADRLEPLTGLATIIHDGGNPADEA
ncbi:MAG TPA: hypothetical protein VFO77_14445 [Actinoplanes sp.]|nr:hypothetical protein [Actinoplanes sp.]